MGERSLTDADYDRLADALNRFHGERAMNLEQLDGFFAALICGPDLVRPSEYLPEIWGGGEMADEEAAVLIMGCGKAVARFGLDGEESGGLAQPGGRGGGLAKARVPRSSVQEGNTR